MSWDQITPLIYTKWHGYLNYDEVIKQSQGRVNNHPIFKLVDQDAKWIEQRQNDKSIALDYQEYVSQLEADRTYADQFDAVKERVEPQGNSVGQRTGEEVPAIEE